MSVPHVTLNVLCLRVSMVTDHWSFSVAIHLVLIPQALFQSEIILKGDFQLQSNKQHYKWKGRASNLVRLW